MAASGEASCITAPTGISSREPGNWERPARKPGEEARGRARRVAGVQKSKVQKRWSPGVSQSQGVEPVVDKRRGGGVWLGVSVLEAKMSQLWSR